MQAPRLSTHAAPGPSSSRAIPDAQSPLRAPALLVFQAAALQAAVPLGPHEVSVGRGRDCSLSLDDAAASRRHCRVRLVEARAVVEDCGSRNGTVHRGRRVQQAVLDEGDELQIGESLIALVDLARPGRVVHAGLFQEWYTDPDSGLPNARGFRLQLERRLAHAAGSTQVGLLRVELGGPELARPLLRQILAALQAGAPPLAGIGRTADHEFSLLLPATDRGAVVTAGEALCRTLAPLVRSAGGRFAVGGACWTAGAGADALLLQAGRALFQARNLARGLQVVSVDPSPSPVAQG